MPRRKRLGSLIAVLFLSSAPLRAQGGFNAAALSGVVSVAGGAAARGATVVATNIASRETVTTVTNDSGTYSFPALAPGTYSVRISLQGFKTAILGTVTLHAGTTNDLPATLELGPVSEVVAVSARTDLLRTQTPAIQSTVNTGSIEALPHYDRNALNFLIFLPGVETIGGAWNARASTVSGLPQNTINITIDGISTTDLLHSDRGFYSLVTPRLDALEEVSLTTASAGAEASGQGAVQIRFVTRSGTNRLEASAYGFFQHKTLNSNTFFNRLDGLPRLQATNATYGGRVGGPIVIPHAFDGRGRAFFFFNLEEVYNPTDAARQRTIIRESALGGDFTYNLDAPTTVNVMALAAANGQTATFDPVILNLLRQTRVAAQTTGTIHELPIDPNTAVFSYLVPSRALQHAPTANLTVNVTPRHRLQGSYYWQRFMDTPDVLGGAEPPFPGFPIYGDRSSYRTTASLSFRSTLSSSMVNEIRGGWQWSPFSIYANVTPAEFASQGGFNLSLPFGLTSATPPGANYPLTRNTANWTVDDTFNWLKGSHGLTFGLNFTRVVDWEEAWQNVSDIMLGVDGTYDPAEALFTTDNFPGASDWDLWNARDLYALLTGRVTFIQGGAYLNDAGTEYVYNGRLRRSEHMDEYGFYAQDQWRWTPKLTLTAGLRYQLQMPVKMTNGVFTAMTPESACGPAGFAHAPQDRFCNIFNPGAFNNPTAVPEFIQYSKGTKGYSTDRNNLAPNVGVSWRPAATDGWLRRVLGDPDQAIVSAGYTRSFNREHLDRFVGVYSGNPGQYFVVNRGSYSAYPLVPEGESWPLLFRETGRLGPPDFPKVPTFPTNPLPVFMTYARIFDPRIQIPYTDSWSASLQRPVRSDAVVEVRYVGNVNRQPWATENWNAINIYETGFFDEFRLAQANLRANVLAGRGGTFAYFGPGTGTSPLPIFLAHFSALPGAAATDPRAYTAAGGGSGAAQWTNAGSLQFLDPFFPNPARFASFLVQGYGGRWFQNARTVGYPSNFWVMNPLVAAVSVTRNLGGSHTDQVIIDFRKRLSRGLAITGSYTWSRTVTQTQFDLHLPLFDLRAAGVPHALKVLWTYDIPVGRGRRFGSTLTPWLDGLLGGWTWSGSGRTQIQSFVLRNAVLVGMTRDEAQRDLKQLRFVADPDTGYITVWDMPQDIIDNTRRAYRVDETLPSFYPPGQEPTGRYFAPASSLACPVLYPGDCGTSELWFHGRWFGEVDFRLAKRFQLPGRTRLEFGIEVFNALMAKNFPTVLNPSASPDAFRVTETQSGPRTAQISWRVTW